jgi:hypothetical protein
MTTRHRVSFVVAVPGEVEILALPSVTDPPVDVAVDGDEAETAGSIDVELDERGAEELNRVHVPQIHLDNPPPADDLSHHASETYSSGRGRNG